MAIFLSKAMYIFRFSFKFLCDFDYKSLLELALQSTSVIQPKMANMRASGTKNLLHTFLFLLISEAF